MDFDQMILLSYGLKDQVLEIAVTNFINNKLTKTG